MDRFANLKLSTKLSVLLGVFLIGFLSFTALTWRTLEKVKVNGPVYAGIVEGKDIIADILPPPEYIVESYLLVLQMNGERDKAVLAGLVERGRKLRGDYEERHAFWAATLGPSQMKETLVGHSYAPAIAFFELRDREFIPAVNAGNWERANALAHGELEQHYDQHRAAIDRVVVLATNSNRALEREASEILRTTTIGLFGLGAVILALVLWVAWLIARSLVARLQRSSVVLTSTATQISATSKEQQSTVNGYSASTTEIAAAVKQISATSQELQATLEQVSGFAADTARLVESGRTGLSDMDQTMGLLSGATGSISSKLSVIREKANDINLVVTTITKVADQTNLLSVNAAIEAEKAGEYGLGFLVVAREIRRLADQSAVATLDIEQMVRQMQGAVSSGVMEMDKFTEQVRQGVQAVGQVGAQLGEIMAHVQSLSGRVDSLNEGMRSQSEGAQQISDAMTQLTEGARQTAASLKEFNSATDSLRDVVQELRRELSSQALA